MDDWTSTDESDDDDTKTAVEKPLSMTDNGRGRVDDHAGEEEEVQKEIMDVPAKKATPLPPRRSGAVTRLMTSSLKKKPSKLSTVSKSVTIAKMSIIANDDEEKKIIEGADALLNLAGIGSLSLKHLFANAAKAKEIVSKRSLYTKPTVVTKPRKVAAIRDKLNGNVVRTPVASSKKVDIIMKDTAVHDEEIDDYSKTPSIAGNNNNCVEDEELKAEMVDAVAAAKVKEEPMDE